MSRRGRFKNKVNGEVKERDYFRDIAVPVLVATGIAAARYNINQNELSKTVGATAKFKAIAKVEPLVEKACDDSVGAGLSAEAARASLDSKGYDLGDCAWLAVKDAIAKNVISLPELHDAICKQKSADMFSTVDAMLTKAPGAHESMLSRWGAARELILIQERQAFHNSMQELHGKVSAQDAVDLMETKASRIENELISGTVAWGAGAGGAAFMAPVIFAWLASSSKMVNGRASLPKVRNGTGGNRREEKKDEDTPVSPITRKDGEPAKSKRETIDKRQERTTMLEIVALELNAKIGDRNSAAMLELLERKLSPRILGEIMDEDYSSLRKLLKSSKKRFEIEGIDTGQIIAGLDGHADAQGLMPDIAPTRAAKRRHHALDDIPIWGWKANNFHNLLNSFGFDTSEAGGGGHFFVSYHGRRLRHQDGRFVLITHRTSAKPITPGLANRLLKTCADFLVEAEDTGLKNRVAG